MNPKALLAVAFVTGAGVGGGAVKLTAPKPVELQVQWQNDHVWATGRQLPDAGREVALRRCSVVSDSDGGVVAEPCAEHVLDAGESACWATWLKCSP